jgi:hypothetical protein
LYHGFVGLDFSLVLHLQLLGLEKLEYGLFGIFLWYMASGEI